MWSKSSGGHQELDRRRLTKSITRSFLRSISAPEEETDERKQSRKKKEIKDATVEVWRSIRK